MDIFSQELNIEFFRGVCNLIITQGVLFGIFKCIGINIYVFPFGGLDLGRYQCYQ